MKVILVPQWLNKALEHANLNLATVTDFKTLSTILSSEDVAKYLLLNESRESYIGRAFSQSFEGIDCVDYLKCVASDKYDKIMNQLSYLRIKAKPGLEEAWLGRDVAVTDGYTLSTQLVSNDMLIITPILGHAAADARSDAIKFMDQLIGLWASVTTLEAIAPTPFFKEYLSLLRGV